MVLIKKCLLILSFFITIWLSTASQSDSLILTPENAIQQWASILVEHVDSQGYVNYEKLNTNRDLLDQYIKSIEYYSPTSHPELFPTKPEQLAYYINAYNALVFKGVLLRGPEQNSVWKGLISGYGFFVKLKFIVGGESINLKSLEDDFIREKFLDPRIHAAINCASISCPRLIQQPYLAESLDQQLNNAMIEFVNSPNHVTVNDTNQTVSISKIFDWFEDDFINFEIFSGDHAEDHGQTHIRPSILHYINRYRDTVNLIDLDYSILYKPYNKGINSQTSNLAINY